MNHLFKNIFQDINDIVEGAIVMVIAAIVLRLLRIDWGRG